MQQVPGNAPPSVDDVRARHERVRSEVATAAAGRAVEVVAVTKGFGPEVVRLAAMAGFGSVGESYAQEARAKWEALGGDDPGSTASSVEWHFIGRLQRNKVRALAPFVSLWQSVDSQALVDEIARRAPGAQVLCQVDLAGQPGRGGCTWRDLDALVEHARAAGLDVRGLMGVGPLGPPEDARQPFRRLAAAAAAHGLAHVSMGMSGDYVVAVEEGATIVRLGSTLFGQRPPRQPSR